MHFASFQFDAPFQFVQFGTFAQIDVFSQIDFTDFWTFVLFPLFPLTCWILFLYLLVRKKNPLPASQRRDVVWGAVDVALLMGSMLFAKFAAQLCAGAIISNRLNIPLEKITAEIAFENANILVGCSIIFSLAQMAFAIWYLKKTQAASWADLGIQWGKLKKHACVGLVAALMIIPVILMLNIIFHSILKTQYSHQVLTMVKYSLITTAISTVIVAPIVEEFHFRVFIQGFLQRLYDLDVEKKVRVIQGDVRAEKYLNEMIVTDRNGAEKSGRKKNRVGDANDSDTAKAKKLPWWPIIVSSLLFASVHFGQGAAPYALFVLAMFLGFLYRQTHSVIPCIIVHFMLNLWSFVALVYSID